MKFTSLFVALAGLAVLGCSDLGTAPLTTPEGPRASSGAFEVVIQLVNGGYQAPYTGPYATGQSCSFAPTITYADSSQQGTIIASYQWESSTRSALGEYDDATFHALFERDYSNEWLSVKVTDVNGNIGYGYLPMTTWSQSSGLYCYN